MCNGTMKKLWAEEFALTPEKNEIDLFSVLFDIVSNCDAMKPLGAGPLLKEGALDVFTEKNQ